MSDLAKLVVDDFIDRQPEMMMCFIDEVRCVIFQCHFFKDFAAHLLEQKWSISI